MVASLVRWPRRLFRIASFKNVTEPLIVAGGGSQDISDVLRRQPIGLRAAPGNKQRESTHLRIHAPGLTPSAVMETLAAIHPIDVHIPTVDGRWLILPRYTQPETEAKIVLDQLKLDLPTQPPPRITADPANRAIATAAR